MDVMTTLALFGAGGKMGGRIIDHLSKDAAYRLLCIEVSERGRGRLAERGIVSTPSAQAVAEADIAILALPDRVLGGVARDLVPGFKAGTLVVLLDPAAAHAGELPPRPDVSYFISHPCHPSVFDHFQTQAEQDDFFGGTRAHQAIVCALMQGPESDYDRGEALARKFYAPVTRSHRVTVEQMAILEPTMAEVCGIALIQTLKAAMEEAIRRGVPREAAEDFMFGHIKVPLGIAFERVQFPFSDGAKLIADYGRERLLQPEWKRVFEPERVREQCRAIVNGTVTPAETTVP